MTDNTPKRRFEDRLPAEKLDWEGPEVKAAKEHTRLATAMATAGAALLRHTGTAAALAAIPNSAPQQYVVAGTLAIIAKVLPAEQSSTAGAAKGGVTNEKSAVVPPLTAPAPLTDELKQLRNRVSQLEAARIGYASELPLNADGEPDVGNIHANIRALKAQAAPAPQQSESIDEQRKAISRAAECVESYGRDDLAVILREVAKAAPAAPVQARIPAEIQGMADCMVMVRQELIEAGVIDASVAPMFIANAVVAKLQEVAAPVQTAEINYQPTAEYQAWFTKNQNKLRNQSIFTKGTVIWNAARASVAAPVQADKEQIRNQALEDAAKMCEAQVFSDGDTRAKSVCKGCAAAIRALIAPSTGEASKGGAVE